MELLFTFISLHKVSRVDALKKWIDEALPRCFWLPGFTYPTGFLTALLQTSARKNGIAIDTLSWEFPVVNTSAPSITQHAKDGSYCYGLFLEGAHWDFDNSCLTEPTPMELFCSMPVIHFKPVENKKKSSKGMYSCPLYMYPLRTGSRERPSFVISCDVKSGAQNSDYWTFCTSVVPIQSRPSPHPHLKAAIVASFVSSFVSIYIQHRNESQARRCRGTAMLLSTIY